MAASKNTSVTLIDVDEMDKELVDTFAKHHTRMGKSEESSLQRLLSVSAGIVEQLGSEGLNPTDIAFIMLEIIKQKADQKQKHIHHDMAFV